MPDVHEQKRVLDSFLSRAEKSALLWLAARTPARFSPDTMTSIGILGSILIFLGYALTNISPGFLWMANLGFVVNWYGDSMDGTLARYRKIERPKFGFYVDHVVDAYSQYMVFIGLGLSRYVRFEYACLALVGYLLVSIVSYVRAFVIGEFRISYAKFGPTEVRLLAMAINTLVFFIGNPILRLFSFDVSVFDAAILIITLLLMMVFVFTSINYGRDLVGADER
ncbi:MAG: CDP-alcohol phosphatidyltransferase [Anaerolineales bacterium]|nr:CDP-alcohol phosphatidyltransferase [Anaerolineales bacterium]